MTVPDHLRRALPLAAVAALAGAMLVTGWVYVWFGPMLLAVALAGCLATGWPAVVALLLALGAPLPWMPTADRAVLLALVTTIVWTTCHLTARRQQDRARRVTRERTEAAADAVVEERLRIARDLHDMVSHGMSVITIQARYGALVVERDPAAARDSLDAIDETGQDTLRQLRQMLDLLRGSHSDNNPVDPPRAPAPGLGDIPALLQRTEAAGLTVDLDCAADLRVPADIGLCTYRVVQEGVANALRHSGAPRAQLSIEQTGNDLRVTLTNETRHHALRATHQEDTAPPGPGHGLVGIKERVALLGGSMQAGARPTGDFTLQVVLPCTALAPEPADRA